MSHFSTVKTELRDRESLLAALRDLGQEPSSGEQPVRGYRGQTVTADLCCPQSEGGDIGFRWNSAEQHYELVTDLDLWKQSVPVSVFGSATQRYALQSIRAAALKRATKWRNSASRLTAASNWW